MLIVVETSNRSYSATSSWPKSEPGPPEAPGVLAYYRRQDDCQLCGEYSILAAHLGHNKLRHYTKYTARSSRSPGAHYLPRIPYIPRDFSY